MSGLNTLSGVLIGAGAVGCISSDGRWGAAIILGAVLGLVAELVDRFNPRN